MIDKINCCFLALIAFAGNIIQLVFFFNYSLKLKDRSLQLEKQEIKNNERIRELEKKNGAELEEIRKLNQRIQELENHLKHYALSEKNQRER